MNKNSQAWMDFLMTYGWAILVVLMVFGVLGYFGVLDFSRIDRDIVNNAYGNCTDSYDDISAVFCLNRYYNNQSLFEGSEHKCSDAQDFYCKTLRKLNINCLRVNLYNIEHSYSVASFNYDNKSVYCTLDQEYISCMTLKG